MRIGLISDTHNNLPADVRNVFKNVDLILHAGDIGDFKIIEQLRGIAPTEAVYGNTDIFSVASVFPSKIILEYEGFSILMLHNIGKTRNFVWNVKKGNYRVQPDIVIYGHTHQPKFEKVGGIYFINPGSAGMPRGGFPASVMLLNIFQGKIKDHKIVQLKI